MNGWYFALGSAAGLILGYALLWPHTSIGKWWRGRK